MTIDEMIEVLQAIKAGEMVQAFPIITQGDTFDWFEWPQDALNFQDYDYRVKRKPVEMYVNVFAGGLGSNHLTKKAAEKALTGFCNGRTVKFIEVIE